MRPPGRILVIALVNQAGTSDVTSATGIGRAECDWLVLGIRPKRAGAVKPAHAGATLYLGSDQL